MNRRKAAPDQAFFVTFTYELTFGRLQMGVLAKISIVTTHEESQNVIDNVKMLFTNSLMEVQIYS